MVLSFDLIQAPHAMSCQVMSCDFMRYHVMSCQILLFHVYHVVSIRVMTSMSCHVMLNPMKSRPMKSSEVKACEFISSHFML